MAKSKTAPKKIELKPIIRIRVRCKACSERPKANPPRDPWLRRLYVVWAPPPAPAAEGEAPALPRFNLSLTDDSGWLSPPHMTKLDPSPLATIPMIPGHKYLFYFVRHPGPDLPEEILELLQTDLEAAKKRWGEWREIDPQFKQTGKTKKGQPIFEGVLDLAEDPAWFIPKGSSFYGGWVLFRQMPGTGVHRANWQTWPRASAPKAVIQCEVLHEQVRRLQYHLGALRYPIGNQWHPYFPEPFAKTDERKPAFPRKKTALLYPNEGIFDVKTWNCVLAFQRDAAKGTAVTFGASKKHRTLTQGAWDPVPPEDWTGEMAESTSYVTTDPADRSVAFASIRYETVVDESTGDAIKRWLDEGLRKPGQVLVALGPFDSWMCDGALPTIRALSQKLKDLGVRGGAQFNSAFRDTQMSVETPGEGQVIKSIHKSGFAFDFTMRKFISPDDDYPLYFIRDDAVTDRVRWIVYAKVKPEAVKSPPPEPYVQYVQTIEPWVYDPMSTTGGQKGPPVEGPFLNFTKVLAQFGLIRISAHRDGWQFEPATTFKLTDTSQLRAFVARLGRIVTGRSRSTAPEIVVNGADKYALSDLGSASNYLALWLKVTARHEPKPDFEVEPQTKEGGALLRALRTKQFLGKKVLVTWIGPWDGDPTSPGSVEAGLSVESREVDLGPKAEFPKLTPFTLRPITTPVSFKQGDSIELPALEGRPQHMEWWHFQYEKGYSGKKWGDLLSEIGWTAEGLLGKKGGRPKYGLFGLGYLPGHLTDDVA